MTFQTEFELLQDDLKEIVKNHLYRRSARRILIILRIIVATVLGICAIFTAVAGETTWAIFFGFVCLVVVGVLILAPRLAVRSLQNTPFYQGKVHVQVDDYGTRFVYETGDSNTQWSGYIRFLETKNLFMLYVSEVMFRPIPKRALSPGQVSELREMLQKKITSPGK
jgi:YcxB-like protein